MTNTALHLSLAMAVLLASCASEPALSKDPPSGTWSGDYGSDSFRREPISVDLRWNNASLGGMVHAGLRSLPLTKASFIKETGAISMEFDAEGNGGRLVHYVIEGKVDGNTMTGTWSHDNQHGDFRVTKQ
jgi:hypothetical protein